MRNKFLAISLSLLFFGSMATSSIAATMSSTTDIAVVKQDDDKDKKKAKAKNAEAKSGECAPKKECCSSGKSSEGKTASSDKK